MNIVRFLGLSLLIASPVTIIHGSEAHATHLNEESDEFFSLSFSDTELEVEENENTQSSGSTGDNIPKNTKSDAPDGFFRKAYCSLWKDASLGQKASEVIVVGLCTSGIAYKYSEPFRKKVDTYYKKIKDRIKKGYSPVHQPFPRPEPLPSEKAAPPTDIIQHSPARVMGEELSLSTSDRALVENRV